MNARLAVGTILARWWLVLLVTVATAGGVLAYAMASTSGGRAVADVAVSPSVVDYSVSEAPTRVVGDDFGVLVATEVLNVQSEVGRDPALAGKTLAVQRLGASQLIRVEVKADSTRTAVTALSTALESYLEQRQTDAVGALDRLLHENAARLASLQGEVAAATARLARAADTPAAQGLLAQQSSAIGALATVRTERDQLLVARAAPRTGLSVTRPASVAGDDDFSLPLGLVGALALGLLLGATTALLLDAAQQRVRTPGALQSLVGPSTPVIALAAGGGSAAEREILAEVFQGKPSIRLVVMALDDAARGVGVAERLRVQVGTGAPAPADRTGVLVLTDGSSLPAANGTGPVTSPVSGPMAWVTGDYLIQDLWQHPTDVACADAIVLVVSRATARQPAVAAAVGRLRRSSRAKSLVVALAA